MSSSAWLQVLRPLHQVLGLAGGAVAAAQGRHRRSKEGGAAEGTREGQSVRQAGSATHDVPPSDRPWCGGWLAGCLWRGDGVVQINHMLFRLMHTRGEEMEEPGALPLSSALLLGHPHPGSMSSASGWLTAEMLARQGAEVRGP